MIARNVAPIVCVKVGPPVAKGVNPYPPRAIGPMLKSIVIFSPTPSGWRNVAVCTAPHVHLAGSGPCFSFSSVTARVWFAKTSQRKTRP